MIKKLWILLLGILLVVVGCTDKSDSTESSEQGETENIKLTISAAASLKGVMEEIEKVYKDESGVKLKFNYGASGSLQQQISQGAPVDLFFSAAEDKFNLLVEEGIIAEEDGVALIGNELVLIGPKETNMSSFDDIKGEGVKKMSIGTPESVPAGTYAKEALQSMGYWQDVESKIVFAKDVRQVLSYVETGNVEAGIVYRTDALSSDKIKMVESAPLEIHSPIIYPVGVIKESKRYDEAKDFLAFLQSEQVKRMFEDYGFTTK